MAGIALINPPITGKKPALLMPSLGLGYLAAALQERGLEVKIIDAPALGMDAAAVCGELAAIKPEIAGLSATTPLVDSAFDLAKRLRSEVRWLVLGGAHASAVGGAIFEECPELDFGFAGEGEVVFPQMAERLLQGEKEMDLPGVIVRGQEFKAAPVPDPEKLAFPAWELMPMQNYRHPLFPGEKVATVISSRGCPYNCIFCDKSVCGSRFRPRSPESVLRELEQLHFNHGAAAVIFYDDLFTLKAARVIEICRKIIERGLKLRWKCEGRVNLVDEDTLWWMRKAGCECIAYGIESCRQASLDWLNKGVKVSQIENAVQMTRAAGIKVLGYFIFGIPGETIEDEMATVEFAIRYKLDYVQFASLSPFPGSELYEQARARGWYRESSGPAPEEYGGRRPLLITDYWSEARLKQVMRKAYRRFYFRPGYLAGMALRPRGLLDLFKSGFRLSRWLGKDG